MRVIGIGTAVPRGQHNTDRGHGPDTSLVNGRFLTYSYPADPDDMLRRSSRYQISSANSVLARASRIASLNRELSWASGAVTMYQPIDDLLK
jgi:hypothetical protein